MPNRAKFDSPPRVRERLLVPPSSRTQGSAPALRRVPSRSWSMSRSGHRRKPFQSSCRALIGLLGRNLMRARFVGRPSKRISVYDGCRVRGERDTDVTAEFAHRSFETRRGNLDRVAVWARCDVALVVEAPAHFSVCLPSMFQWLGKESLRSNLMSMRHTAQDYRPMRGISPATCRL